MDITQFLAATKPLLTQKRPWVGLSLTKRVLRKLGFSVYRDPYPDVVGLASEKKLALLQQAVSFLPPTGAECYLEIGTYQGKSLIAALMGNPGRPAVACDNFSLFADRAGPGGHQAQLKNNLARYQLEDQVRFFDCDFKALLEQWPVYDLPPVGVYFYDGAHDEESQYLGIRLAESRLADEALVIVDDWRYASDSQSFAAAGTNRAIAESTHAWQIEHILPARWNGDLNEWWNGVGLLSFRRK